MALTLGLVGLGTIARAQHLPAIAALPGLHLAAIASRNASLDGVDSHADIHALLAARPDIAAISLCTPPQGRFEQTMAAIAAGRHLMLEKPPAATLSELDAMARAAQARGVTLFATWHSRHAAAIPAARDWLAGRRLTALRIDWREDVRKWHPGQQWIWQPGGLGVFDPGINALSILTALIPDVVLTGADLHIPENRATPIAANLTLAAGGVPVSARFDWRETGDEVWQIAFDTDAGTAILSGGGATFHAPDGTVSTGENNEYKGLYSRFLELIEAGASDVDPAPLRLIADACMTGRSHRTAAFHD